MHLPRLSKDPAASRANLVSPRRVSLSSPTISLTFRWQLPFLFLKAPHVSKGNYQYSFHPTDYVPLLWFMKQHGRELVAFCRRNLQLGFLMILICHISIYMAIKSLINLAIFLSAILYGSFLQLWTLHQSWNHLWIPLSYKVFIIVYLSPQFSDFF